MPQQMAIKVTVFKKPLRTCEINFAFTDAATFRPIEDVRVEIGTIMGQMVARGNSDKNGLFKASNIPEGEYGCRFEHQAYATQQKLISLPSGTVS